MARVKYVTFSTDELVIKLREVEEQMASGVVVTGASAGDVSSSGEVSRSLDGVWQDIYDALHERDSVSYPRNSRVSRTGHRLSGPAAY